MKIGAIPEKKKKSQTGGRVEGLEVSWGILKKYNIAIPEVN